MMEHPKYGKSWEELIKDKMRPCATICKIEDPAKRNQVEATKRWRKNHKEQYDEKQRIWRANNPDKIKAYQEKNKANIKRWDAEHKERRRELGRKYDHNRYNTERRQNWTKEYLQRPEVIERRRERDRLRNKTPERREYERLRSIRRREAKKLQKQQAILEQWHKEAV